LPSERRVPGGLLRALISRAFDLDSRDILMQSGARGDPIKSSFKFATNQLISIESSCQRENVLAAIHCMSTRSLELRVKSSRIRKRKLKGSKLGESR
jgi:hypothetical protein